MLSACPPGSYGGGTGGLLERESGLGRMWVEANLSMFAAMLLAISVVALSQFALYYWRAILAGVAAQPVSDRVLAAANLEVEGMKGRDFEKLSGLHELTPELGPSGGGGLTLVRAYYRIVAGLGALSGVRMPAVAEWCERERVICARYAAVQMDRRLQVNLALVAALRSC
jgi:hypothetical protein